MSTTDGGNTWQVEILDDFIPGLNFYDLEFLENGQGWVTGLSDLLLENSGFSTSIPIKHTSNNIMISPNPCATHVYIDSDNCINNITVFNSSGRIVYNEKQVNQKRISLDLSNYPPGIYFFRIDSVVRKVIKH